MNFFQTGVRDSVSHCSVEGKGNDKQDNDANFFFFKLFQLSDKLDRDIVFSFIFGLTLSVWLLVQQSYTCSPLHIDTDPPIQRPSVIIYCGWCLERT